MPRPIKLLLVEDSPDDAELLLAELRRSGYSPDWKRVYTEPEYIEAIKSLPEIILSDYSMPQFNGLRAAKVLRDSGLDIPFILISGTVGEDTAVEAMKHGASDYLLKDRIARLGKSVELALEQKRMRAAGQRADEEIREQLSELRRWHEATLGREERVLELKREVNELLAELQRPPRYTSTQSQ